MSKPLNPKTMSDAGWDHITGTKGDWDYTKSDGDTDWLLAMPYSGNKVEICERGGDFSSYVTRKFTGNINNMDELKAVMAILSREDMRDDFGNRAKAKPAKDITTYPSTRSRP